MARGARATGAALGQEVAHFTRTAMRKMHAIDRNLHRKLCF